MRPFSIESTTHSASPATPPSALTAAPFSSSLQIGPISWVGNHRYHHREADRSLDPHTPLAGFAWAHFLWTFYGHPVLPDLERRTRSARDLARDPFYRTLERHFLALNLLLFAALLAGGWFVGGPHLGASLLVWGGCLRVVAVWHATFLVNSAAHVFGRRRFDTNDTSRNSVFVAVATMGEGWHNNHHHDPNAARQGRRWFELDPTYGVLRVLQWLGFVWDLRAPRGDRGPERPVIASRIRV